MFYLQDTPLPVRLVWFALTLCFFIILCVLSLPAIEIGDANYQLAVFVRSPPNLLDLVESWEFSIGQEPTKQDLELWGGGRPFPKNGTTTLS